EAAFGRVPTRWESTGGYPVLRVVALMVLRQHVLTGLALGAYRDSELGLAATLWPQLPDASLVILDREFAAYALYHQLGDAPRPPAPLAHPRPHGRAGVAPRGDALGTGRCPRRADAQPGGAPFGPPRRAQPAAHAARAGDPLSAAGLPPADTPHLAARSRGLP